MVASAGVTAEVVSLQIVVAQLHRLRPAADEEIEMMKILRRHGSKDSGRRKLRRERAKGTRDGARIYVCRDGRGRIVASR
jgi:hypothetical protein